MANIPSLGGEAAVDLRKVQEVYPLPKSRKEILIAFERILNLGGVHRVVVELGSPIKVTRLATPTEEVPEELQDDDIVSAARNVEMEEFLFLDAPSTMYLLHAFRRLTQRRLKAKAMVVNNYAALRDWLGVDRTFDVSEVFGVQTVAHKEIPDGVLLLVAAPVDDVDLVSFSMKLEMTEKKP